MRAIGQALIQRMRTFRTESGQTLTEYGVIILFVAVALVLSFQAFAMDLDGVFQTARNAFP